MIALCRDFEVSTKGHTDINDITSRVEQIVSDEGLKEGLATVFTPGATASISTIEYESGAVSDLREAVRRLAPEDVNYRHDARWGDGNGFSHVRASLLGPSLSVPIADGRMTLGTWQQIVFVDFDNRSRSRSLMIQFMGE